jgi:hypothetical protein
MNKNTIDSTKKALLVMNRGKRIALVAGGASVFIIVLVAVLMSSAHNSDSLLLESVNNDTERSLPRQGGDGDYDYTEAIDHIGEKATVTGTVLNVFTSKSGTVFFDFCDNFQTCSFSAVVFASDVPKFENLEQYEREVKITGLIKSYQGKAEIIINGPEQIELLE